MDFDAASGEGGAIAIARLKAAVRRFGGVPKVSEVTGVPIGTLNKNLNGESKIAFETVRRIVEAGVMSPLDLFSLDPASDTGSLDDNRSALLNAGETPDTRRAMPTDLVALPQYDVKASAGPGLVAIEQMPTSEVAFERAFIRSLGGAPDKCFLMWASGDSMLPTISDGALLLVDSSQTIVDDGRIYVFSVGTTVVVKRARWRLDGRLELASDNVTANYPVETFQADRIEDLYVVGRVIFIGKQS